MDRAHWTPRFAVVLVALLLLPGAARAEVTVQVAPADTTIACNDTVLVRVEAIGTFTDLKAYQLVLRYGDRLVYAGMMAGEVLTGTGRAWTLQEIPDAVAPADTAWADCAQLVGSASCPGVLLYLRFVAPYAGEAAIECLHAELRDSWNQPTLPACVGAQIHVKTCPVPVTPTTWGALKTIYR
jgi:hypothetical protein